jgi:hypothetical protein
MDGEPATAANTTADEALDLRDQALAALDEGDPSRALDLAGRGLATLDAGGLRGGLDESAVLIAHAKIEEALGRFDDAQVTIATALAILQDAMVDDAGHDTLMLWCQAQERLAGLERLGATTPRPRTGCGPFWTGRRPRWERRR